MKLLILTIFGLLFLIESSIAQDTTYLDKKIEYFSKKGDHLDKTKNFPKYSKEKIQISKDSFKVEYCYYFDKKRYTSGYIQYYGIINDSILTTGHENWSFKKLADNNFHVVKQDSGVIEKGNAYSIIPFIKNGDFFHLNDQNDTLLIEYFRMGNFLYTKFPKIKLKGKIYNEVDEVPKFPSKFGDLKTYIENRLIFPAIYAESSISGKVIVKAVITASGKIKIFQLLKGVDPPLDNEALKVISRLPEFESGKLNGKKVNTYFIIPVEFILH